MPAAYAKRASTAADVPIHFGLTLEDPGSARARRAGVEVVRDDAVIPLSFRDGARIFRRLDAPARLWQRRGRRSR